MSFNVDTFRRAMKFDGARPNLFEVRVRDIDGQISNDFIFKCKAASLPGSTMGVVEVPFFGRQVRFAGNRTFTEWSVTILNDEDFDSRNRFERWHRELNSNAGNVRNRTYLSPAGNGSSRPYQRDADVIHYGKAGNVIRKYRFTGLFPSDVSAIDLDWGNNDTIEEFTVTFAYQYWVQDSVFEAIQTV